MPRFEVRLESQTDQQSRTVTLSADNADDARARCQRQEARLVSFSLLPTYPVAPDKPDADADHVEWDRYETELAAHATAMEAFPAQLQAAEQHLQDLNSQLAVNEHGKIIAGPKGKTRANWHAHHQELPYTVVSVEEKRLGPELVERLGRELASLHEKDEAAWEQLLADLREKGIPLAAVSAFMFGVPVKNQYDGTAVVDWDTDTIKVALATSTYTPNQDTHDFFNDVTNEVSGTGYTAGGATLGSAAATYDSASDQARLDAADSSWSSSTITARYAVVYKSTGTGSTSPLMALVDFGADVSTTNGTFLITWDATGILVIDVT